MQLPDINLFREIYFNKVDEDVKKTFIDWFLLTVQYPKSFKYAS